MSGDLHTPPTGSRLISPADWKLRGRRSATPGRMKTRKSCDGGAKRRGYVEPLSFLLD